MKTLVMNQVKEITKEYASKEAMNQMVNNILNNCKYSNYTYDKTGFSFELVCYGNYIAIDLHNSCGEFIKA